MQAKSGKREARRLFSVDEVNALIPRLDLLMTRVQQSALEVRRALDERSEELGRVLSEEELSDFLEVHPELVELTQGLQRAVNEIEGLGGEFKGLELGLVDFPAEIEGEVALLCWQFGETEISHWHGYEEGFASRKPLPGIVPKGRLQ